MALRTKAKIEAPPVTAKAAQPKPVKPKKAQAKVQVAPPAKATPAKARGKAAERAVMKVASPVARESAAGRAGRLSAAVRRKVCEALVEGCTRKAACGYAGIGEASLAEWLDECPEFREAVTCAENEAEKKFAAVILAAAQEGNWKAAAWWLERRRKDDYSARREVKHGGGIGVAKAAVEFDDDELATIAAGSGPGTDSTP